MSNQFVSFISDSGICWKISIDDENDLNLSLMTEEEINKELEMELEEI